MKVLITFMTFTIISKEIICDNGPEFWNCIISDFCKFHKIELHYIVLHNTTSNSPVKRLHSTFLDQVRCLTREKPHENVKSLMKLWIMEYNTPHSNTKYVPFDILFGYINQTLPFDINEANIIIDYIKQIYKNIHNKLFTEK